MITKINDKNNIEISANTNTLKSAMFLKNNYEVDFRNDKSINSLLGFHSNLYTSGFHESENMVNILIINSILVSIDIISGSYVIFKLFSNFQIQALCQPLLVLVVCNSTTTHQNL